MIAQDRELGWLKFSGTDFLTLGGGGGLASATLFSLGLGVGRVVLDDIELDCAAGTNLRVTFTGPGTNIQLVKIIGPGERWSASGEGIAASYFTTGVAVLAFLIGAGASSGYVRVSGKVV